MTSSPAPSIETPRLKLAPLEAGDVNDIAALHADPRVAVQLLDGVPATPEHAAMFIVWAQQHYSHGFGTFAARRRGAGTFLGLFSLVPFEATGELELGGKLAPVGWGRGFALEAGAALVAHAFDALGRETIVSSVDPANSAAAAVLAALGFQPAGACGVFGRAAALYRLTTAAWSSRPPRSRPQRPVIQGYP